MSKLPSSELLLLGSHKKNKGISTEQQKIIDAINEGWTLYRNNQSFTWHMKRKAEKPFGVTTNTVYKPTVVGLLEQGVIARDPLCTNKLDTLFILK